MKLTKLKRYLVSCCLNVSSKLGFDVRHCSEKCLSYIVTIVPAIAMTIILDFSELSGAVFWDHIVLVDKFDGAGISCLGPITWNVLHTQAY